MQSNRPNGRVAVVTGASRRRGIGAAICRALAAGGADVLFTHWSGYDDAMPWGTDEAGPEGLREELDFRREADAMAEMAARLDGFFGRVDDRLNARIAASVLGDSVLDVGCGFGSLTEHLRLRGLRATGTSAPRTELKPARIRPASRAGRVGQKLSGLSSEAHRERARWAAEAGRPISDFVYDLVAEAGGSISAEHGIGQMKLASFARLGEPARLSALRALKAAFDPLNIMNPGKLIPASLASAAPAP